MASRQMIVLGALAGVTAFAVGFYASLPKPAPLAKDLSQPLVLPVGGSSRPTPLPLAAVTTANPLAETPTNAVPHERVLHFKSGKEQQSFLNQAARGGVRVVASIPQLNAVRVRFDSEAALDQLLKGQPGVDQGLNFQVSIPAPVNSTPNTPTALVGFGSTWIQALGLTQVNPNFGQGIRVGIVDTGVDPSIMPAGGSLIRYDVTNLEGGSSPSSSASAAQSSTTPSPAGTLTSHATAVASLIVGDQQAVQGLAPLTQLISVKALDSDGQGDSFTVAAGIVQATDAGSQIINLSVGSSDDSPVMSQAVAYALNHGVALVSATGNEGVELIAYPAAYPGVLAVGAIDATLQPAYFSNYGDQLGVLAPGVGLTAGQSNGQTVSFSGTSAATGVVSAALSAILSTDRTLSPTQASQLLCQYANDIDLPGRDPETGYGEANVARVLNRNTPNIVDASIASQFIIGTPSVGQPIAVGITVQNRGTTPLLNASLTTQFGSSNQTLPISYLPVNQSVMQTLQVPPSILVNGQVVLFSQLNLNGLTNTDPSGSTLRTRLTVTTASSQN